MNDLTSKNSSSILAAGGAGFLALAGDLPGPRSRVAARDACWARRRCSRRSPRCSDAAAMAVARAGGAARVSRSWAAPGSLAVTSPALLPALALVTRSASIACRRACTSGARPDAAVGRWRPARLVRGGRGVSRRERGVLLPLPHARRRGRIAGAAADPDDRLAGDRPGAADRGAQPASPRPAASASGFIAVAVLKALVYDSTHLQGPLRVTVFAAVGALLLAGARLINDRERA